MLLEAKGPPLCVLHYQRVLVLVRLCEDSQTSNAKGSNGNVCRRLYSTSRSTREKKREVGSYWRYKIIRIRICRIRA
jgi:hypothetical protein